MMNRKFYGALMPGIMEMMGGMDMDDRPMTWNGMMDGSGRGI